ncbi:glutamate ABC transporter substrate-binding protein [Corynebacterium doosanense]|uniref:Glutamate-binding protein n=1 Tax=Corynebacterium doosanense CAU 212 = DSM 45436 TaxID=558173 RepID=A0A097IGQ1_9CORY|nr:glutamate ABC transporter substrate-binding protein [Corynebacterium doosanense]AIT61300.1 glutamate-binding protein [Corynebacterium doosanense CAU 212 = DSM 45436]
MKNTTGRILAATAIVATAATALTACAGSEGGSDGLLASIEAGSVTLGTKFDQPGLGLRNADGSMSGLDVDIATEVVNRIAEKEGHAEPTIEWRETPSAQRETLIQNGEVDMIAATYSINAGRAETVSFGGPYLLTHQALLVRADETSIDSLESLDGKILCSVTGSTPAQKVKEALPGVQLQEYDTYSSCTEALRNGNVDAMTTDATILNGYSAQSPGDFTVIEMEKDGEPFTNEHYGIGVTKDDQATVDAINEALNAIIEDGTFDKIVADNLGDGQGVSPDSPGDLSFLDK